MSDKPNSDMKPDTVGQMLTGVIECLSAFGLMLARRGLISREELAKEFWFLANQQGATISSKPDFEARATAAVALAERFSPPVSWGPTVIRGGKSEPEPPDTAA